MFLYIIYPTQNLVHFSLDGRVRRSDISSKLGNPALLQAYNIIQSDISLKLRNHALLQAYNLIQSDISLTVGTTSQTIYSILIHLQPPLVHPLQPNPNCPSVRLQLLNLCQLHNRPAHIPQTLGRQIGAGNVLDVRPQVHTRVLLGIAICCCYN